MTDHDTDRPTLNPGQTLGSLGLVDRNKPVPVYKIIDLAKHDE